MKRWARLTVGGLLLGLACGAAATEIWPKTAEASEPIYLSMTVRRAGRIIAHPQLVAETGKDVLEVLRQRDGAPRLSVNLRPRRAGDHYGVDVQLDLPDEQGLERSLALHHGQQIHARMSHDVDLDLLVMRVRSPEFEAYVQDAPIEE